MGDKTCSSCKFARYCSKEHQTLDWTCGHKVTCGSNTPSKAEATFPEFVIESDDEPGKEAETDGYEVDALKAQLGFTTVGGEEVEDDLDMDKMEETQVGVDDTFLSFQRRISRDPEQVMRYARTQYSPEVMKDEEEDVLDHEPLWCSKVLPTSIPACPHCHGPRTFEFQIMPQLVAKLNQAMKVSSADEKALDWGSLYIFSCEANCQPKDVAYMREYVWKQDFSNDGVEWPTQ
jgi:pre-rRNA-processing protein TSR4